MKKPILLHLTRTSPFLKTLRLRASMTSWGKLFHLSTIRSEKKRPRRSRRHLFFEILAECPPVLITELMVNGSLNDVNNCPVNIRRTSKRPAWFLLSSSVHNPNLFSHSSYVNCLKPGARCKYKTGRHNWEMGDRSSHTTLSSREIGRSLTARLVSDCGLLCLPRPLKGGVSSQWCRWCRLMRCMKYEIIISDLYYVLVVVQYLMSYVFHSLKHLRAC